MIKVQKITKSAQLPTLGSTFAAGYDLYADISKDVTLKSGETVMIGTGIAMSIPKGTVGLIVPRSGLASKEGLANINSPGILDSDYTGEIKVALHNYSSEDKTVAPFDRIAQLVITPVINDVLEEVDELESTERADGGFGSTGK